MGRGKLIIGKAQNFLIWRKSLKVIIKSRNHGNPRNQGPGQGQDHQREKIKKIKKRPAAPKRGAASKKPPKKIKNKSVLTPNLIKIARAAATIQVKFHQIENA
jgi:hypothetical protein